MNNNGATQHTPYYDEAIASVYYLCSQVERFKDYFWTRLDLEQFLYQISLIRLKN